MKITVDWKWNICNDRDERNVVIGRRGTLYKSRCKLKIETAYPLDASIQMFAVAYGPIWKRVVRAPFYTYPNVYRG